MKLKTYEWGQGDKTAQLVHGVMSSHGTWVRVVPRLVALGYHVTAVDLRGHGASGRSDLYTPDAFAADLVETLAPGADLAIGHSLGGLSLSLAVGELRPKRAVYSDPAWTIGDGAALAGIAEFAPATKTATAADIRAMNPRWVEEDVQSELEGFAAWDVRVVAGLQSSLRDFLPAAPVVPSLVQSADPSFLITPELGEELRGRGFEVRFVPDTGHVIHRDDLDGFFASLEGWL